MLLFKSFTQLVLVLEFILPMHHSISLTTIVTGEANFTVAQTFNNPSFDCILAYLNLSKLDFSEMLF